MSPQTHLISFHRKQIVSFTEGDRHFIALKPVCENIGIGWDSQRQRLKRDEKFNSTTVMITAVAEDHKKREMVCLPLEVFPGWLYTIDTGRVRNPRARDMLRVYQQEATRVLYEHFFARDPRLHQNYRTIQTEYKLLKDNFIIRFIEEKRDEHFKSNLRIFHQAQWYWRLYRYFREDMQKTIDHVGLFSFTINRYLRRFEIYLHQTREIRILSPMSRYDDWTAEELSPVFAHANLDFWEMFLKNDPLIWEPHKYVLDYEQSKALKPGK